MLPEESRMKATSTGELHGGGAGEKERQVSHAQVKCAWAACKNSALIPAPPHSLGRFEVLPRLKRDNSGRFYMDYSFTLRAVFAGILILEIRKLEDLG